ncbi:S1C family serine protease [Hoyosella altamirensis]|uniref:Serine protease Do n=1 Tax=Hoyosella altamirensis TaxID=616997 RepID=A0A839RIH9_9ACTN|nr:S1C family serine protease [Hoyosella altamirensis]MBB3035994.1 serine protease Do [Hoyosella altamirensis]
MAGVNLRPFGGGYSRAVLGIVTVAFLMLAGCGSEPESDGNAGSTTQSRLDGVRPATVRIVAEGTFVDPEVGLQLNAAGSGSGFIIDPSGIVVTNNHVVTGAALLRVYIDGEDQPRNARVLGYSECSDLAVIDVEGEGFPSLDWHDGEANVGLDVYTAGYPLGDPEFTLTRGIISKARADGNTDWASVDSVIEHDATINPGNSGGPLVTADGKVVGVNYAGNHDTRQYFAISPSEARPLIDRLRSGENVTSIGINGQAVTDGAGLNGVWVAAVASGSVAAEAGIEPGDIITHLERLELATDGTMADFCDILRSRSADDVMAIEVVRFANDEVLAGQLGGSPLEQKFSFADELADEVSTGSAAPYESFVTIADESGAITVEVPAEWSDVDGTPFSRDGAQFIDVRASSDLESFTNSWDTPGVIVTASADLASSYDETSYLDRLSENFDQVCNYAGRFDYSDPLYAGMYDMFDECGGTGAVYIIVSVMPEDRSAVIGVQIQINDERDFEALDHVLASFVLH